MNATKDINKFKKQLIQKAQKKGLYENFGQKEVNKLLEKYEYQHIADFDNWCMNYTGK